MTRDEELKAPFHTDEPLKAAAKRLRIDPVRLRALWNEAFGEAAMLERGKRIRAASATAVAKSIATTRVYSDVEVPCSACGSSVALKSNQVVHLDRSTFRCERCSGDRDCPVCGQRVDGERGLSAHFRHRREAGDEEHVAHERDADDAQWAGKEETRDYVTCRECGLRSSNLSSHVRVHGMTAEEYRTKHGEGARLRSEREQAVLNQGTALSHQEGKHAGTKKVTCPECDAEWDAPKSLAVTVHDTRCAVCRAIGEAVEEEARWEGKSEPADYVTCRVCGHYRAENLTSHLQNAHREVVGKYGVRFPGALLMTVGASQRIAVNRISLTPADLAPYMDKQGRVEVAKAADGLGCVHWTVLRYCRQFKLPTRNRLAFQKRVLDLVAAAVGSEYVWEWSHTEIRNSVTNHVLYFDGLFAKHGLLVEAHGAQHFKYIPYWHKSEAEFEARRELDAHKVREAEARGYKVLVVRFDEPFTDPAYLAGRLVQMGVLEPGQGAARGGDVLDLFG